MKAIIFNHDLGQHFEEVEIPEDMKEQAEEYNIAMIEAIVETI